MAFERLSSHNESLISSYAEHIQRYQFASTFCQSKHVLDAGCGVGYGSQYLSANGARYVLAIDISDAALYEAKERFGRDNLKFEKMDVETIDISLGQFDLIVNFENLEHLTSPSRFLDQAALLLGAGTLITSTPNGAISNLREDGKPANKFHVKEFTAEELSDLLSSRFETVTLYGQWLTHGGKLRKLRARELFDQLNEAYHNPTSRIGRFIKRLVGRSSVGPPRFTAGADSLEGDYVISPFNESMLPWPPTVLIAVCEGSRLRR